MSIEKLILEKGIKSIKKGNSYYIHITSTNKFLEICLQNNLLVLGIEGIYCGEGYTKPDLNLIGDFTPHKDFIKNKNTISLKENNILKREAERSVVFAKEVISSFPKDDDLYVDFAIR